VNRYNIIENTKIGKKTVLRSHLNLYGCEIGRKCKIACFVEIQRGVKIGDNCKIEAFAFIPSGVTIEDGVFIGPHVCFTNDRTPRAVGDWEVTPPKFYEKYIPKKIIPYSSFYFF